MKEERRESNAEAWEHQDIGVAPEPRSRHSVTLGTSGYALPFLAQTLQQQFERAKARKDRLHEICACKDRKKVPIRRHKVSKNDFREEISCISVVSLEVVEINGPKKRCVKSVHSLNQAKQTYRESALCERCGWDKSVNHPEQLRKKVLETVDDFREKERRFQKYRVTLLVN